jgi:hypothetical protein
VSQQVGILDWHQEPNERPRTFLRLADARNLVQRLAAEEIRNGLIRMFPPDSVFYALRPISPQIRFVPSKLPPAEVENCKFIPPLTDRRPRIGAVRSGWDWSQEQIPA